MARSFDQFTSIVYYCKVSIIIALEGILSIRIFFLLLIRNYRIKTWKTFIATYTHAC